MDILEVDAEEFFEGGFGVCAGDGIEVGDDFGNGGVIKRGDEGKTVFGTAGGDVEDIFGIVVLEDVFIEVDDDDDVAFEAFEFAGGGEEDAGAI